MITCFIIIGIAFILMIYYIILKSKEPATSQPDFNSINDIILSLKQSNVFEQEYCNCKIKRRLVRLPADENYFLLDRKQLEQLIEQLHHCDRGLH